MKRVLLLTTSVVCLLSSDVVSEDNKNETRAILQGPTVNTNSLYGGITELIYKAYRSCPDKETIVCIRKKTLNLLDTLSKEKSLPLISDTLFLVRDTDMNETIEDNTEERSLADSFTKFLNNYRLQLKLPKFTFIQTTEEGRKKNKGGYGGIGLMMGGSMLAMGMAALAALSGKALAASMAALMMAAMAAMKKHGGGGGGHSSYEVITVPSHHHRSFYEEETVSGEEAHHDGYVHHQQQGQHDDIGIISQQQQHHHHHDDHGMHYEKPYQFEQHEHIHTSEIHDPTAAAHVLHDAHLRDHHIREHHIRT